MAEEAGESVERGIQLAVSPVLVSPYFLFKVERDDPSQPDQIRELNDFELATRLSYFLWSSMPDDTLFHLAEQGKLRIERAPRTSGPNDCRRKRWPSSRILLANGCNCATSRFANQIPINSQSSTKICDIHASGDRVVFRLDPSRG